MFLSSLLEWPLLRWQQLLLVAVEQGAQLEVLQPPLRSAATLCPLRRPSLQTAAAPSSLLLKLHVPRASKWAACTTRATDRASPCWRRRSRRKQRRKGELPPLLLVLLLLAPGVHRRRVGRARRMRLACRTALRQRAPCTMMHGSRCTMSTTKRVMMTLTWAVQQLLRQCQCVTRLPQLRRLRWLWPLRLPQLALLRLALALLSDRGERAVLVLLEQLLAVAVWTCRCRT